MYSWKDGAILHDHPVFGASFESRLDPVAAALSAYLETHQYRLLEQDPILTAVPSRAPLIGRTMQRAGQAGWFARQIQSTGEKRGAWFQHLGDQVERCSRTEHDWDVRSETVEGRHVLLLDDVFVTGTSVFSYAKALQKAGAATVRAVVVVRHVSRRSPHYSDAWRIARRTHDLAWSPARSRVATLSATLS
jgi:phosphoribosylpyrophosphate synthetase